MDQSNKVIFLTDELIATYTGDNVLTEYQDIHLNYTTRLVPYANGVYDSKIFGSIFSNRCNCGQVKIPGIKCPRCGSMILDEVQAYRRYARIDLPIYYCNKLKFQNLIKFLRSSFQFKSNFSSDEFAGEKLFSQKVFDTLQFNLVDKDKDIIEVTDNITDVTKCSYEGILDIILENYPDKLNRYKSYINSSIIVLPIIMRPPHYSVVDKTKLENEQLTTIYKNIIYASENYYKVWYGEIKTEPGKAIFNATFRNFINSITRNISDLVKSSKANIARQMQSTRISNSGRCTIVPAPNLNVDEVYIPRHLMYECCKDEFIDYLKDKLGISVTKAELMYNNANNDEVQGYFDDYVNGTSSSDAKYVFILRNPTLHELNIMMCRVKLTNDYCMKIPMAICKAFNADFDGDSMAFFSVPKKLNDDLLHSMSPRNLIYYKKDHNPLFLPTHEIMMGLILATKMKQPDGELQSFESIDEAKKFRKTDRNFKYQTQCLIGGVQTTLAREILSQYFDKDVNAYIESLDWDRSMEVPSLNSKNCIPLYTNLADYEDRPERIQKIQEFALMISTISGATAPTISELYKGVDSDILDEIEKVNNDENLDKNQKDLKIRELYADFVNRESIKYKEVKVALTESSRAKVSQLHNIILNQLNVGPDHVAHVSKTRLIEGMNPTDYSRLAIENRATQDIKVSGVPLGGYQTRQISFLAQGYRYLDQDDPENKGIELSKKDAIGRTTVDGEIVTVNYSGDKVKVRSIVTSSYKDKVITRDMIPNIFKYTEESSIGISMMTSLTEGLTQSSLALKHGGNLFGLEPNGELHALDDVTVEVTDDFIVARSSSKVYKYFKPDEFVLNYAENNKYNKGELIGIINLMKTPTYLLDCTITLIGGAKVTPKKHFAKNNVLVSDCYSCNEGTIHYVSDVSGKHVFIDDEEYNYNPNALYFLPEGTHVNKYDRICSGIMDINITAKHIDNYIEIFKIFFKQFRELHPSIQAELIEFLYTLITRVNKNNKVYRMSIKQVVKTESSIITSLSFEDSRRKLAEVDYEGKEIKPDTFALILLPAIFNNNLI